MPLLHETLKVIKVSNDHIQVLYHTEVDWLSWEKVLSCHCEFRTEIAAFFSENNSPLADLFNHSVWLARVAYLVDVFEQFNTLNLFVQGRGYNIFEQSEKNEGVQKEDHIVGESCFQMLVMRHNNWTLQAKMLTAHLTKLQGKFHDYFQQKHRDDDWVCDPFTINMESVLLPSHKESQLVELSCDQMRKKKFT